VSDLDAVRQAMGPIGAFLPYPMPTAPDIGDQVAALRRLERAGYGAVWVNEVPGKDALVQLSILLAGTDRIVLGTGVVNVWSRSPHTAHGAATLLAQAFPGRFILGIGGGHPGQATAVGREFGRPLATMRDYLGQMTAITPGSATATPYPRLIGANGPKMLELAAELADGAIPAMVDPSVTAQARTTLGQDKLLVVLIDASTTAGDPGAVAAVAAAHRAAGADHVVALLPMGTELAAGVDRLERLAPPLRETSTAGG